LNKEIKKKANKSYFVHPENKYLIAWNFFMNFGYIISFFITPYTLAFNVDPLDDVQGIELFLDFMMLIDIVLTFFTATIIDVKLETDFRKIAWNYIRFYFIFDVLSCVPGLITWENEKGVYFLKVCKFM